MVGFARLDDITDQIQGNSLTPLSTKRDENQHKTLESLKTFPTCPRTAYIGGGYGLSDTTGARAGTVPPVRTVLARGLHAIRQGIEDRRPARRVFAFHESPGALQRLTPPWEKVEVESGGESIRVGSRVVLVTRLGPIPLRWVAEHTEYDPPHLFADRQVSGPFARWHHRHEFLDDGQGGTILRDVVDYEPPLGALGRLFGGGLRQVEARARCSTIATRRPGGSSSRGISPAPEGFEVRRHDLGSNCVEAFIRPAHRLG